MAKERKKWSQNANKPETGPEMVSQRAQERKKWDAPQQDSLFEKLSEKTLQPGTYVLSGNSP